MGSDATAAGGGVREQSEWQRSVCNAAAPTARRTPGTATGEPDTLMSSKGQKNFVFFCDFYALLQIKGRFLHLSTAVLNLT